VLGWRELKKGDLSACGHGAEIVRDVLLRPLHHAGGLPAGQIGRSGPGHWRQGCGVGMSVGGSARAGLAAYFCRIRGSADGLSVAVFLDGEVGAGEAADGLAFVVGDQHIDDGFAGVDVEGGGCGCGWVLACAEGGQREDRGNREEGRLARRMVGSPVLHSW